MNWENKLTTDYSRAKRFFEDFLAFTIGPCKLHEIISHNINRINIIDVRDYDEYVDKHIPYAIHIPHDKVEENIDKVEKDKVNVVYSYTMSCPRAMKTALTLVEHSYPAVVLCCGFKEWKKLDFDVVKNDSNDYKM